MSLIPTTKKCPKCGKTYHFNPDVGQGLRCPHCAGLGIASGTVTKQTISGNKKKS